LACAIFSIIVTQNDGFDLSFLERNFSQLMMKSGSAAASRPTASSQYFLLFLASLIVILAVLFHRSFEPGMVVHSNDGPLGAISAKSAAVPYVYSGFWQDLNWLGGPQPSGTPNVSVTLDLLFGPYFFAKFYPAIALLILSVSAWIFFRQSKLAPVACMLGGLAVMLNSDYFSIACWGVAAQCICVAMSFLALAAAADTSTHRWIKSVLAGLAVGMSVMEGFDIGAIFSVFVAVYVLFQAWNAESGLATGRKLGMGILRLGVIVIFAVFIATQTLTVLINTQIKGIAGTDQSAQAKEEGWGGATTWSLPKAEVLQMIVPGLFGYRMDSPEGGNYWGFVGKDTQIDEIEKRLTDPDPQARATAEKILGSEGLQWRFSGGGIYAGVPVVVIMLWAVFQSFRKQGSLFSLVQRRIIWFWLGVFIIGLLMAFGRFGFLYSIFYYHLPFASTIRNPAKFIHVATWAMLIIFGYGVDGLVRAYIPSSLPANAKPVKISAFDKKWLLGCLIALGAGLVGWAIYAKSSYKLESHLQTIGFKGGMAHGIASFSVQSVGWFILFLILTIIALALVFTGQFAGPRAKWGGVLLGGLIVIDLARADLPWIIHWDVADKYASNPVIDLLRQKPYEHRVTMLPFGSGDQEISIFGNLYGIEWVQHLFLYYNIESLDVVQEPRTAIDNKAFRHALFPNPDPRQKTPAQFLREWELTNTRYLLGLGEPGFVEALNQQVDPGKNRFRLLQPFDLAPKPGKIGQTAGEFTAVTNGPGHLGVIEFTGALPRAQLYSNWQVNTNDESTLALLGNPAFDVHQQVLVANPIPAPLPANTNQAAGTVQIKDNYEPKRIELDTNVKVPSVLLLNDKFNADWKAWVDGKPEPILRANYIMRGIYLQPGQHDIVFRYEPPFGIFYVSLSAVIFGIILLGFLVVSKPKQEVAAAPAPVEKPKKENKVA
jgi:hypothetical protein